MAEQVLVRDARPEAERVQIGQDAHSAGSDREGGGNTTETERDGYSERNSRVGDD